MHAFPDRLKGTLDTEHQRMMAPILDPLKAARETTHKHPDMDIIALVKGSFLIFFLVHHYSQFHPTTGSRW